MFSFPRAVFRNLFTKTSTLSLVVPLLVDRLSFLSIDKIKGTDLFLFFYYTHLVADRGNCLGQQPFILDVVDSLRSVKQNREGLLQLLAAICLQE